jgi:benzylsuccinate CoA-transferase BbsF subunit
MTEQAANAKRGARPLDGLRVFELSIAIAGPMCGRALAHFGAEVVKIESRRNPDIIRLLGSGWIPKERFGPEVWADCGPAASEFLTGKKSLGLDLKPTQGKAVARRLLERCDVFISNYSSPAIASLGLDYESVRAIRPDIVYAALSGFGTDPSTPYYDYVAWGPNQAPLVGLDDLTGWADRPPAGFCAIAIPDYSNGVHATVAVLAALEHRDETGEGSFIELAQLEATTAMLAPWLVEADRGAPPRRDGNRTPGAAPHGIYPTCETERWVAIAVSCDEEWRSLCAAASRPKWRDDLRFGSAAARLANQDALDEAIAGWTREKTDDEVAELLQRAGVPAAPVLDVPRVATDPQLRDRYFWILADHARLGRDLATGNPIRLSDTPGWVDRAAPCVGEDNDYVLGEICGYAAHEIEELTRLGVVQAMALRGQVRLDRRYLGWVRHFMPGLPWPAPGERP